MHILLTDLLTCPRCGPNFGLIVLAERLDDRRILEGRLGCSNCRESYPVAAGVADLRHPRSPELRAITPAPPDPERAFRAAALLGVRGANANVAILELQGTVAPEVAGIVTDVHVLGMTPETPAGAHAAGILSRIMTGQRIPVRDRSLQGIAILGLDPADLLPEVARILRPGARVVLDPAAPGAAESLRQMDFEVQLEQDGVVVAAAPGGR
jgi:uncharacterized protein YbaR (Trm112 family)